MKDSMVAANESRKVSTEMNTSIMISIKQLLEIFALALISRSGYKCSYLTINVNIVIPR